MNQPIFAPGAVFVERRGSGGRHDGIRLWVWRAWDKEWVAECSACGEVHWGGGWNDAMVVAWGHLAMHHVHPIGAKHQN